MICAVLAARLAPGVGMDNGPLQLKLLVGRYGVSLIFFLSGLGLKLSELTTAMRSMRTNALVQAVSFGLWPACTWAVTIGARAVGAPVSSALLDGLLVLACLPTTVNMCVVLTQSAGGSVALALTNAVLGNLLGVFVTPLLLVWLLGKSADVQLGGVCVKLVRTVLVPVAAGQALRWSAAVRSFAAAHKRTTKLASETVLLLIIYNTFCNTFGSGGVALTRPDTLALALGLPSAYILATLTGLWALRQTTLPEADAVAVLFCASQKTLAFGLPLIRLMFAGHPDLAFYSAPIMVLHPLQLLVGSVMLPGLRRRVAGDAGSSLKAS